MEADNICIVIVDDATFLVSHLFQQAFNERAPVTPVHYVAFAQLSSSAFEVVGYYHVDFREEYALTGGLCVDARYRNHGVGEKLAKAVFATIGDRKAFFTRIGNPVSERIALRIGYTKTSEQYLFAKWMKAVPEQEQKRLIAEVAALGLF